MIEVSKEQFIYDLVMEYAKENNIFKSLPIDYMPDELDKLSKVSKEIEKYLNEHPRNFNFLFNHFT